MRSLCVHVSLENLHTIFSRLLNAVLSVFAFQCGFSTLNVALLQHFISIWSLHDTVTHDKVTAQFLGYQWLMLIVSLYSA